MRKRIFLLLLVLWLPRETEAAATARPASCPVSYLNVRSNAGSGAGFEVTVCQAKVRASIIVETIEYADGSKEKDRRVVRSTRRSLSQVEFDEWLSSLFAALQRENYAKFGKPGLVQLDGGTFQVEARLGLLHILVKLNGSSDDPDSPLLQWIRARI